jgi:hypothetical protein
MMSGGVEGGQKVLSKPSADSVDVGRRQKMSQHFHKLLADANHVKISPNMIFSTLTMTQILCMVIKFCTKQA